MTVLTLSATALAGMVLGWALRRWAHGALAAASEQSWKRTEAQLRERLSAAATALRTEQGKVAQCRRLLGEVHAARERLSLQMEGFAAQAEASHRQVAELRSLLDEKTQRVSELEAIMPKLLVAESQLAALGKDAGSVPREIAPPEMQPQQRSCDRDDLKEIFGIGPRLETLLNEMGIVRFSQIANWTDEDIEHVQRLLPEFKDRVHWDNWVEGARQQHEKKYGRVAA